MDLARWLWTRRSVSARLARLALVPSSLLYRAAAAARARAYEAGLLPSRELPLPAVAVGNLTVGGSGKTPIAGWIAAHYTARGLRPAILLRGYGGDEGDVHRKNGDGPLVFEDPDRTAGAARAEQAGADVLVLDDAFQRLDVRRDLNIALMSAESIRAVRWTLPAGPWREGWRAIRRADAAVVTRKRADRRTTEALADRIERKLPGRLVAIAHLGLSRFTGLLSGEAVQKRLLRGAKVVAAAGIADPDTFADQCRALGARVKLVAWDDHHRFTDEEIDTLLEVARRVDYVLITEKDAVKLRGRWPDPSREPIVASLDVVWERGQDEFVEALDEVVAGSARRYDLTLDAPHNSGAESVP